MFFAACGPSGWGYLNNHSTFASGAVPRRFKAKRLLARGMVTVVQLATTARTEHRRRPSNGSGVRLQGDSFVGYPVAFGSSDEPKFAVQVMADHVVFGDADRDSLQVVVPRPVFSRGDEPGGYALPSMFWRDCQYSRFNFSRAAHLGQHGAIRTQRHASDDVVAVGQNEDLSRRFGRASCGIPQKG